MRSVWELNRGGCGLEIELSVSDKNCGGCVTEMNCDIFLGIDFGFPRTICGRALMIDCCEGVGACGGFLGDGVRGGDF